ncbi:MAG: site-specific integrase, partial [Bacteroidales bacterium]|nr:site-specific integrase [Bacteroidales bacterium]
MRRNRFQTLFYIRRDRIDKKGLAPIYVRITIANESANMAVGCKIHPDGWNISKGLAKIDAENADQINQDVELFRKRIYEIRRRMLERDQLLSAKNIIQSLKGEDDKKHSLINTFQTHNKLIEEQIGKGYSADTHTHYEATLNHIMRFLKTTRLKEDIYLKEINGSFIRDFNHYLRTKINLTNNTTMKHLVRLKKIIRFAIGNDWLAKDPFFGIKIRFEASDRHFLTKQELSVMEELELKNKKLCKVRDIFIFMCYTGMSYVDVKNLKPDMIRKGIDGNLWIIAKRIKSNSRYSIPLLPKAVEILRKYDHKDEEYSLPVMSNQKMNEYIKEIAVKCGISKPISCHSGRHS